MPNQEEKKPAAPAVLPTEEKDKHNALLAGVIFFMLLIIILWVMNLGTMMKSPAPKASDQLNIDQVTSDFQNAFNRVGAEMSDLKNIDTTGLQKYAANLASSSAASTTIER